MQEILMGNSMRALTRARRRGYARSLMIPVIVFLSSSVISIALERACEAGGR